MASNQDVSQSKSNQGSGSAGRMLKLGLTDGHSTLTAVEYQPVHSLSLDTAPGTKVETSFGALCRSMQFELFAEAIPLELLSSFFIFLFSCTKCNSN